MDAELEWLDSLNKEWFKRELSLNDIHYKLAKYDSEWVDEIWEATFGKKKKDD